MEVVDREHNIGDVFGNNIDEHHTIDALVAPVFDFNFALRDNNSNISGSSIQFHHLPVLLSPSLPVCSPFFRGRPLDGHDPSTSGVPPGALAD